MLDGDEEHPLGPRVVDQKLLEICGPAAGPWRR